MKKIVFILGSMNRGGAERVISILSRDYAEKGWKVDIILLLYYKISYDLDKNVNVLDFTGSKPSRIDRIPFWIKSIRKYVKKEKPDVILSFAARINVISQISTIGIAKRLFVSERNDPRCDGRSFVVDKMTKLLYPKADGVIFQTNRAASYFANLNNSHIIPNPISVEFIRTKYDENKIVYVGRFTKQKNPELLLRAFSAICRKNSKCFLEMYGAGELQQRIIDLTQELKIVDRVRIMGNVSNIHECISDACFFVLPSDFEGLSNALLEAMMMGIPCISTNCAGSNEYIKNKHNGLLTTVGSVEEMSSAMELFITNKDIREECGKNARRCSVAFSKDVVLKMWHDLMD